MHNLSHAANIYSKNLAVESTKNRKEMPYRRVEWEEEATVKGACVRAGQIGKKNLAQIGRDSIRVLLGVVKSISMRCLVPFNTGVH